MWRRARALRLQSRHAPPGHIPLGRRCCPAARAGHAGAGAVRRESQLRQARGVHPDARRREAVHDPLRAEGHDQDVPAAADANRRTASRRTDRTTTGRCSVRTTTFAKEGYIFVYQDTRGKFKSEGRVRASRAVSRATRRSRTRAPTRGTRSTGLSRTCRTTTGASGNTGISWAGWEVSMGMIDAHPALKASSPQAPPQDQFFGDDYHSGGAYQLMYGFNWMSTNARARVGAVGARRSNGSTTERPTAIASSSSSARPRTRLKYFADDVPTYERSHDARRPTTSTGSRATCRRISPASRTRC